MIIQYLDDLDFKEFNEERSTTANINLFKESTILEKKNEKTKQKSIL